MHSQEQKQTCGGKADNLRLLTEKGFPVPPFVALTGSDLHSQENMSILQSFLAQHPEFGRVAVRSSMEQEDSQQASFAGQFQTVLDVPANTEAILQAAESIQEHARTQQTLQNGYADRMNVSVEQRVGIVVQEMISSPEFAGVAFSRSTDHPHYMEISYHAGLGEDLVGGKSNGNHLHIARQGTALDPYSLEKPFLAPLITLVQQVEQVYGFPVDIEFAVQNTQVYLLQARPIHSGGQGPAVPEEEAAVSGLLAEIQAQLTLLLQDNFLGNMIDINPRELQGEIPRPFSYSLFNALFPDGVIPAARDELGYNCSSENCLHLIGGRSYVDFKNAAHNFRPRGIAEEDYQKMYASYLDKLRQRPELHNRIEFELVFCFRDKYMEQGLREIFPQDEQKVNSILATYAELERTLAQKAAALMQELPAQLSSFTAHVTEEKRTIQASEGEGEVPPLLDQIQKIVDHLRSSGTFLFTQVARIDFFLNRKLDAFLVAHGLEHAKDALLSGNTNFYMDLLSEQLYYLRESGPEQARIKAHIHDTYGHLRPSQFDLQEANYAEQDCLCTPDLNEEDLAQKVSLHQQNKKAYEESLTDLKKRLSPEVFTALVHLVTQTRFFDTGREQTKFVFMQEVDLLRPLMLKLATLLGLEHRDDIFLLTLEDIRAAALSPAGSTVLLQAQIIARKVQERLHRLLIMPDILEHPQDVFIIKHQPDQPIYLSQQKDISGEILYIDKTKPLPPPEAFRDKILLLEDSDQGSARLLNYGVKGVVTKIGSAHSHLAVIMREYGLPAMIAVGEDIFRRMQQARGITFDCQEKQFTLQP